TSDGNVWWGSPAGVWTNITAGLPDRYVSSVHGSPTLPNRFFVTHSGIKYNEDIPHVHRSDNNGQTWTDISGNLPQIPVNDLFVLPGHADSVLFAGTDAGTYHTLDGGKNWARLGTQLPYVAVFDLEHNPARKQLMAATFGRGLWTFPLDSVFAQGHSSTTTIGGKIKTEYGAGVADVVMKAAPPPIVSGADGAFALPQVPACQLYEVEPKLLRAPLNGVSTYDLVLISRHILGLEPISSPYRIIAADGNRSGSITTYDIVVLRRLILGIDTLIANNSSWRFVPKNFVFPDTANPFKTSFPEKLTLDLQTAAVSDADFIGIKVGDLNASAQANASAPAEDRDGQALLFEVSTQKSDAQGFMLHAGDWIDLDFRPTEALQGYQMTVELHGLAWAGLPPQAPLPAEHFGTFERSGVAGFSVSCEKNTPFRVRLLALRTGDLRDMLRLSDRVARAEAYRIGEGAAASPLALHWPSAQEAAFALLPSMPNPMQHSAQVLFRLPESSPATLSFRSADGRLLHSVQRDFPKGLNAVSLSASDLGGASGVVFYTLETPAHRATGKMVVAGGRQ
ncbi:MAG TPA: hypothetical protein PKD78_01495, partial [Saprospiraceae bacterium]|nr:hypothetical protein [Saprospiraceae bacterium]